MQVADGKDSGGLDALLTRVVREKKSAESAAELDEKHRKLAKAFRRQVLDDTVRRNVQSRQDKGVNIQALVININHRSLISRRPAPTTAGDVKLRDGQPLSRPRSTAATSAPAAEPATQKAD